MNRNDSNQNKIALFELRRSQLLKAINRSKFPRNASFEVLPVMVAVADYASFCSGKDNKDLLCELILHHIHNEEDASKFSNRWSLYAQIIDGKSPRGEWIIGDKSQWKNDDIIRCATAFGDVLINPECAENYDHAPRVFRGILETADFATEIMLPVTKVLIGVFKDFYDN